MNLDEKKNDRIGQYLVPHLDDFIFDELSDGYLEKAGIADIMTGVPVPLRKKELGSISTLTIARNMAFVIGCDPDFKYKENYIAYILRTFDKRFAGGLIADGVDGAQKRDYDYACIQFRAAMLIDPENADAYYCYGRACKDAYELGDEEEFIGRFKAESLEAFEIATMKNPKHADAFYFLGYGYLNMGLYIKAKLTWEEFMKLTEEAAAATTEAATAGSATAATTEAETAGSATAATTEATTAGSEVAGAANNTVATEAATAGSATAATTEAETAGSEVAGAANNTVAELRKEISERLKQLEQPVEIEKGYNSVISGRFEEGIAVLKNYKEGAFAQWWPLWYYLGVAYAELGQFDEAAEHFLKVLKLSPSNVETMEELVKLYEHLGDSEKAEKYTKKLEIVKDNAEKDRRLKEEMKQAETLETMETQSGTKLN